MKNKILHYLFALAVVIFMVFMLVPSIIVYMLSGLNIIQEIQIEAAKFERKYFDK